MNIIEKKINFSLGENPIPYAYDEIPEFTAEDYAERQNRMWEMPRTRQYDFVVIYGDREHFSNIFYFTGYDPRWEESLLILSRDKVPVLLVGNEGIGYTAGMTAEVKTEMFQSFSLPGQPNDARSKKLEQIFRECGINEASRIGLIGWKVYQEELFDLDTIVTDVPYYIVRILAKITGMSAIENATDIMIDCEYGLKHNIGAKEAVHMEVTGTKVSRSIYHFLKNVKPGMTETEAAEQLELNGEPLNMHPNINFGDSHVSLGLNSPKHDVKLEYGMALGVGYGMRGCLVHKCGMYARNEADIPEDKKHYLDELLKPYFACVVRWYEMMKIGTSCGDIYDMVANTLGMEKFGIGLNPGHLGYTDEWTNSPIRRGSDVKIRSGMLFQCDYTVGFQNPFLSAHIEDGLMIADEELTNEIRRISPTSYERIMARKKFVKEELNIDLPQEVLPLSDLTCVCYPYMADPSVVLAKEEVL